MSIELREVTVNGELLRMDGKRVAEASCRLNIRQHRMTKKLRGGETIHAWGVIHGLDGTITFSTAGESVDVSDAFALRFPLDGGHKNLPVTLTRLTSDTFQVNLRN